LLAFVLWDEGLKIKGLRSLNSNSWTHNFVKVSGHVLRLKVWGGVTRVTGSPVTWWGG